MNKEKEDDKNVDVKVAENTEPVAKEVKKKSKLTLFIPLIIIILLFIIGYFAFLYPINCEADACFLASLQKCSKANYIRDDKNAVWKYQVQGKEGDKCKVMVAFVQAKEGISETESLEGKDMICKIPLRVAQNPEDDLSYCSGELKEKMLEIIIQRMHEYIYQNMGEIKKEFDKL